MRRPKDTVVRHVGEGVLEFSEGLPELLLEALKVLHLQKLPEGATQDTWTQKHPDATRVCSLTTMSEFDTQVLHDTHSAHKAHRHICGCACCAFFATSHL